MSKTCRPPMRAACFFSGAEMQLFVPAVGTQIKLTEPWTLDLNNESRNSSLFKAIGFMGTVGYFWHSDEGDSAKEATIQEWADSAGYGLKWQDTRSGKKKIECVSGITIPTDTVMIVDRVHIRKGLKNSDFDSLTFRVVKGCSVRAYDRCRFWVKLKDANKIQCESINET